MKNQKVGDVVNDNQGLEKRVGRWSGRVLTGDDYENRFGRV